LHVRDVSHADTRAQSQDVANVLNELGIENADGRLVEVWNKIDRLSPDEREQVANLAERNAPAAMLVSAVSGEGVEALKTLIEQRLASSRATYWVTLEGSDGSGVSWLHRNAEVLAKSVAEDGSVTMRVRVHPANAELLVAKFKNRVKADSQDVAEQGRGREPGRRAAPV
jgi:GTP-binding protein HflX